MYANRRKLPNHTRAQLAVSKNTRTVYHFKNAACGREALKKLERKHHPRNADDLTILVREKRIPMKLVGPVLIKLATFLRLPIKSRQPRMPVSTVLGIKRSPEEFATFVAQVAQLFPQGFRQPSVRPDRPESTSLVEKAAIAAGSMEPNVRERSKRGHKKLEADGAMKKKIAEQRENGIDPKYLHAHARMRTHPQPLQEAA